MNALTTPARLPGADAQAAIDAMHDASSADSLALYRLTNIIKLAAFAAESRRVLSGIDAALTHEAKATEILHNAVKARLSWVDFDDVTGDVLQHVAAQLDELNDTISNRPFELQTLQGAAHE